MKVIPHTLPRHWSVKPLKYVVDFVSGGTPNKDTAAFWDGGIPWVSPKDMKRAVIDSSEDTVSEAALRATNLSLQPKGAILIVVRGMILARYVPVAETSVPVTINQDMKAMIVRGGNHPSFIRHYLSSSQALFLPIIEEAGHGTKTLRTELLGAVPIPLPPPHEQRAIVDFIDRETAKIDALIAKQEELIERIAEKRKSLFFQAATKGLDQSVAMKDSGVGWLGIVPAHWTVTALKRIARLKSGDGITSDQIEQEGTYPVFGGNGLRGFAGSYTHDGDFALIGRQGALCGNINYAHGKFWASEHAVIATPVRKTALIWLGELLKSMNLNQYSVAAAQPGLSVESIGSLLCPLPPYGEQIEIAAYLARQAEKFDLLTDKAKNAIALFGQHRSALITAAVTGQIEVAANIAAEAAA